MTSLDTSQAAHAAHYNPAWSGSEPHESPTEAPNYMALHGDRLVAQGYAILPIMPGTKKPGKFTSTGGFITAWGTAGSGNGQFSGPFGIAVKSNRVYVVDTCLLYTF